jgi:hypothetical protein
VLFSTSTFNPALIGRIAAASVNGPTVFDAIVGNPPWTYSAAEKDEDRGLARRALTQAHDEDETDPEDEDVDDGKEVTSPLSEDAEHRSGTTYARLAKVPIPPRSMDWAFLWRCRELRHSQTRIALVMKATPFFSLDPNTSAGRDAILREFPNVGVVNLSQLRTSRLFQEYEDGDESGRHKKRAAGPAMLFFSNCLPTDEGTVTAVNFPWTSSFVRTGVFELPAEPAKTVPLEAARAEPTLLKAALFGTERDVWFLERLSRSACVMRLADWFKELKAPVGQGYQKGTTMPSAHLMGLPKVSARDLRHAKVSELLPSFDDKFVHRAREADIFRGPLVLLPEGRLTAAPALGRYTAAFDNRDLAYNESFVGVSFRGRPAALARAFTAVMHSALIAYQLALIGGTVGIKQTKVEAVDLDNLRIPHIDRLAAGDLTDLASAADILASEDNQRAVKAALVTVDRIVARMARLTDADDELLSDVDRRARAILFETEQARRPMETPPTVGEINTYSRNLCSAFNAFATEDDDLVLIPDRYTILEDDLVVVKFVLAKRIEVGRRSTELKQASIDDLATASLNGLGGNDLRYLKPAKSLRMYVDRAIYMLKPAQYRCFSPASGQSDGDRIVADLMHSPIQEPDSAIAT